MVTERVQQLINETLGTCNSLTDEQEDWTEAELQEFDDQIFCCDCCGWWFDISDMADEKTIDMKCMNCADEEDD